MKKLNKIQREVGGAESEKAAGSSGAQEGEDPFLGIKSHMAKTVHDIKQVSCLLSVCARHTRL